MGQGLSAALMLIGAGFTLIAAIGVARMPDVYTRLHASTKSATLGAGCLMVGAAVHFYDLAVGVRALAIVVFLFATAPVAAHMIGRAAYLSGVPLWPGTLSDELRGCYDRATHRLASDPGPAAQADRASSAPDPEAEPA